MKYRNKHNNAALPLWALCFPVLVFVSCLGPVGIEPGGGVSYDHYDSFSLQGQALPPIKNVPQWQVNMKRINLAGAGQIAKAVANGEEVPQPVFILTLAEGVEITLPPSGDINNPALSVEGVTVVVRGVSAASPAKLKLGANGSLLTAGTNMRVILQNIILEGKSGNDQPLVKVTGGALELLNGAVVTGNEYSGGNGGGVHLDGGELTLGAGAAIRGNSAKNGGGVYAKNSAGLTIEGTIGSVVPANANTAGDEGGGLYLDGSSLDVLAGSRISGNTAKRGGGIFARGSSVLTAAGTIGGAAGEGNTSTDGDAGGGGIYLDGSRLSLESGALVSGNISTGYGSGYVLHPDRSGGGIRAVNGSFVAMYGTSLITGNTANPFFFGGGVGVIDSTFVMTDTAALVNNYADNGGGAYLKGTAFTMTGNSAIRSHTVSLNHYGGGVFLDGEECEFTMNDSSVIGGDTPADGNVARVGGGIYLSRGLNRVYVNGSAAIKNNFAACEGGGIGINASTLDGNGVPSRITLAGGTISHNTAGKQGGGIIVGAKAWLTFYGGSICDNQVTGDYDADSGDGGGIFLAGQGDKTYVYIRNAIGNSDPVIFNNYASRNGGGLFKKYASSVIDVQGFVGGNTSGLGVPGGNDVFHANLPD
jgi:hypothetical protein